MKVAVTGGAGFIGSHLVDLLLRKGHEVVIIDNFCTGSLKNVDRSAKNLSIVDHDIRIPMENKIFKVQG